MMQKIPGTEFGYVFDEDATSEELREIADKLKDKGIKFRSLICNSNMRKRFRIGLLGNNCITINNSIPDNQFYINYKR